MGSKKMQFHIGTSLLTAINGDYYSSSFSVSNSK